MKLFSSTFILFATVFALLTSITPSHAQTRLLNNVAPAEIQSGTGGNPTATFTPAATPSSTPASLQRRDIDLEERGDGQLEERQEKHKWFSPYCLLGYDEYWYNGNWAIACCYWDCCSFYNPLLNDDLKSAVSLYSRNVYLWTDPWCEGDSIKISKYGKGHIRRYPSYYSMSRKQYPW